jgi:hypothetical protein
MTNAQHTNENQTIHIKVKDYATWRPTYDGHEKSRLSAGVTNGRVFRSAEDPNDVVILQNVADVKELEAENTRLRRTISDLRLDKLFLQEAVRGSPGLYNA